MIEERTTVDRIRVTNPDGDPTRLDVFAEGMKVTSCTRLKLGYDPGLGLVATLDVLGVECDVVFEAEDGRRFRLVGERRGRVTRSPDLYDADTGERVTDAVGVSVDLSRDRITGKVEFYDRTPA